METHTERNRIAAGGCSGDSDPDAESPPATTTEQVETQRPAPPAVDIAKFRAAFKERFGETSWYGHITGMKMSSGNLEITTDLDSPSDAGEIERGICGRAAKLALDLGMLGDGIKGVVMTGSDGVELGGCG